MSRTAFLMVLAIVACGRPRTQTVTSETAVMAKPVGQDETVAKNELVQLEKEWATALQAHDTAFFERTFAEEFMATTTNGTVDRTAMIRDAGDTSVTFMDTGDEDQVVRLYEGGNVGVVTGRVRGVLQIGGQRVNQLARYTEVFVKRNGRWQAVAGHYSPLTPPKK